MGEFLLSYLGFDANHVVIYKRIVRGSKHKAGDAVPFVHPNQQRKTKRIYYRILEKFYEPELIIELLTTQDPNVIDRNGFVPYQRILVGKDMYSLALVGHSFVNIAALEQYAGWNKHAVEYAINKYKKWQSQEDTKAEEESKYLAGLDYADTSIKEPIHANEGLTEEYKTKRDSILAQWD